ncbi:MAG: hypothetical protein FWD13_04180 [Treponema sp.]|nr:hypothetical protein [Treponema sp.]
MIAFKPDVRITDVNFIRADLIDVCFSTENTVSSTKTIFDALYMLNGLFTIKQITSSYIGLCGIDAEKLLGDLTKWEIIHEISNGSRYIQAKEKLRNKTVHFPLISNINVMIAVLLQKMRVKTVFYENKTITQNDVIQNIYYNDNNIGKDIISFLQNELKIDTVFHADTDFNIDLLNEDIDIIVNSDSTDWINAENHIVINTWNYHNSHFKDFKLFNGKINVSDELKPLIEGYILATRSVDDILYSVIGNLVF